MADMIPWLADRMREIIISMIACFFCLLVYAGGSPEYVGFPADYKSEFIQYDKRNRANGSQVAMMYANKTAVDSVTSADISNGAVIIMEVYKTMTDDNGNPVTGADGIFEMGPLAAIAVMEKRADWPDALPDSELAGNWGFAIYQTDGTPKQNDLACATCHRPRSDTHYMFSYASLKNAAQ